MPTDELGITVSLAVAWRRKTGHRLAEAIRTDDLSRVVIEAKLTPGTGTIGHVATGSPPGHDTPAPSRNDNTNYRGRQTVGNLPHHHTCLIECRPIMAVSPRGIGGIRQALCARS